MSNPEDPHTNGFASLTDFSLLKQEVGGIKTDLGAMRDEMRGYFQRSSLRSLWPMIVGVAAVLWLMINQQIQSTSKEVGGTAARALSLAESNTQAISKMLETQQIVVQQNATSLQDRSDKGAIIKELTAAVAHLSNSQAREVATRRSKSKEVEAQLRGIEGFANLQRAYDNRMLGLLFQKEYGFAMPAFQYYPHVANPGMEPEEYDGSSAQ